FELQKKLSYDEAKRVSVRAMDIDGTLPVLRKGPRAVNLPDPSQVPWARADAANAWEIVGSVESIHPDLVEGWVRNLAAPDRILKVSARVGDLEIGRAAVNGFRGDLGGRHGFAIELDNSRVSSLIFAELEVHVRDDCGHETVLPRRPHISGTIFSGPSVD